MRLEETFVNTALENPGAPAVVDRGELWTYGQLHNNAAAMAGAIRDMVDQRADRVGIVMERGADAYAAVLAALLAGAAYVPINPGHPASRIKRTLELAELDAVVVDGAGLDALIRLSGEMTLPPILAPEMGAEQIADLSLGSAATAGRELVAAAEPIHRCQSVSRSQDDLAYLLFTSGSTGQPKGVPISHHNVMSFLVENGRHYRLGPDDRCSQTFDLTFDLSVFDMFMTWQAGACLYPMLSQDLMAPVEFVQDNKLTVWFSVPSVAALLSQRRGLSPNVMPSLRYSLFCGEALTVDIAKAWAEAAPRSVVENLYGPTELTIACSRYRWRNDRSVTEARDGVVPIGTMFPGMDHLIVGPDGVPVAAGEQGELCVTGPQRFRGYWRNRAKTLEQIIIVNGRRYYRTGDRVVDDGRVMLYLGRGDNQVQVMGHRVELGEVESALRALDGVVDAVAYGLPLNGPTVNRIAASVTLVDGSDRDGRTIRRAVADLLPDYKRPRRIEIWDRFPLNTNGKIDRRTVAEQSELEPAR